MAPPPPANLPLKQKVIAVAKTLQFGWFTGHVVLLLAVIRYAFSWARFNYQSKTAQAMYRLAFLSAAATYGIVVYKTWRARQKPGAKSGAKSAGYATLLTDENVQYLGMALVWLLTPQYPLAMLPYAIYSVFHVATYTRDHVIPTFAPSSGPNTPDAKPSFGKTAADRIGDFVKTYYDNSMSVVSALEVLLWVRLFISAVLFNRGAWVLIALYTAFLRSRYAQSSHVKTTVRNLETRGDALASQQNTPPLARKAWNGGKSAIRQFYNATDVNTYSKGAAVPKKTT